MASVDRKARNRREFARLVLIDRLFLTRSSFWWVWLLVSLAVWILHRMISKHLDKAPDHGLTLGWGAVRTVLIIVMQVCLVVGLVLLVRWVRSI
jgi:uncharacterized membrane protein YhaH (DUF805 family)